MALPFAASDPSSFSQWGAGGAAILLLTVAIGLIFRILYMQRQENKVCDWRLGVLVRTLTDSGISVPAEFWEGPPDVPARKKRGLNVTFSGKDESGSADVSWLAIISAVVVFAIGVTFVFYVFVIQPLNDIKHAAQTSAQVRTRQLHNDRVDRCVASLTADYFVAIQRALAAPPAPGAERAAAVKDLGVTAERIRNRVDICRDGKPDDFAPTPVTEP